MLLIHGQEIAAQEIERIVGCEWSPKQFAALCNAVAWGASRLRTGSLPSFTERVNAQDGGVDVGWDVELSDGTATASPLLVSGWNVFQHKQRDVFAQGRQKTISNLVSGVKGAIQQVFQNTQRWPSNYVLFTNIDLSHEDKNAVRKSLSHGYSGPQNLKVEVVGAAEIAAFLNNLPHLRSSYFATANFTTWQEAWNIHSRAKLAGAAVSLTGRDDDLKALRAWIDAPTVRVVVVAGPPLMGKSRLVLEATKDRQLETVVALDPISFRVSDLLKLISPGIEVLVLVEDPDPNNLDALIDQALARPELKLIVALPTEGAVVPDLGRDDRVRTVPLQPITNEAAQQLLKAASVSVHYGLQSWIVEQAAGNPGVVLWAASVSAELGTKPGDFANRVARAFEAKVRRALGDEAVAVLQLLSLLTDVGHDQHVRRELEVLCNGFGGTLQLNTILNWLPRLQTAGVIRCTGAYAQVVPPPFANYLATKVLRGRGAELLAIFAALPQPARARLVRRLRLLKSEEAANFWDALFAADGLLGALPSALTQSRLLRLVGGAVPEKVAALIHAGLASMSVEARQQIGSRRELMWTVEEILFRRRTSTTAIRCLALLAEAETENCGNNSTGVFGECFRPLHPQLPIPLSERLVLIKELAAPTQSRAIRLLSVKAVQGGLHRMGFVMLRRSNSGEPFDGPPVMTYAEVWDYFDRCVEILFSLARDEDKETAKAAQMALPGVLTDLAFQSRPVQAVQHFETLVKLCVSGEMGLPASEIASALQIAHHGLSSDMSKANGKSLPTTVSLVARLESCLAQLEGAGFSARLKRWAGHWGWKDHEAVGEEQGRQVFRHELELRVLAQSAVTDPAQLTDELFDWVCSPEAHKSHVFFWELGSADKQLTWKDKIGRAGSTKEGVTAFSCYFGGVHRVTPQVTDKWLDDVLLRRAVSGKCIIEATGYLAPNNRCVKRLEQVLASGDVERPYVAQQLGFWATGLPSADYLRLLKVIAGRELDCADAVVDMLCAWIHHKKSIEGDLADLAWSCLASATNVNAGHAYHFDQLATELVQTNLDRGFNLLDHLFRQPYDKQVWMPIERHSQNDFWDFLRSADRQRALRLVFTVASEAPEMRWLVSWEFKEVVNQEEDADILIAIALENEGKARCVAETITSGRLGFWPVALKIVEAYPNSERILGALSGGVQQMGVMVSGPWSSHQRKCLEEVNGVLANQSTPSACRPWLEHMQRGLQKQFEVSLAHETDEEVNQYLHVSDDQAPPERIWAICELIRRGQINQLCKVIPKQELLELLQELELTPEDLAVLRRRIETDA